MVVAVVEGVAAAGVLIVIGVTTGVLTDGAVVAVALVGIEAGVVKVGEAVDSVRPILGVPGTKD